MNKNTRPTLSANFLESLSAIIPAGKTPMSNNNPPKKETQPTIKSEPPIAFTKIEKIALMNNPKLDIIKMLEIIANLIFLL